MAPIVDGLIPEYENTVAIRKYNVEESDEGADLARGFDVIYVPTFVFVDADGEVQDTLIGEMTADALREALDGLN
jgi:thioredoxin-related protein